MKIKSRILSALLLVCCLVLCGLQTTAAGTDTPRVVFENARNTTPDLSITKHVQSAVEGYHVPTDTKFSFILKLNGKLAKEESYRVFDGSGEEVFNLDMLGNKNAFQTDRSGGFTLLAEQTALFEYVGAGVAYEVAESQVEGFAQTKPAGGTAAVGTVPTEGELVEFVNVYRPDVEGETTKLVINKTISFPTAYEAPETPDFRFTVKLQNRPYAQEPYTITNSKTGEIIQKAVTGVDGSFLLKGGCTATFEDIPANVDYEVTETVTEGWHVTGESSEIGATTAPVTTADFNNASASFAVSKELEDHTEPDVEFTFLLTKADHVVWSDASYYLYHTVTGKRVDDTIYTTDAAGQFVLKPGQTAVFFGIDPGTLYNVSESGSAAYTQIIPAEVDGYSNKVVTDAVEVLPFINRAVPITRALSVTKLVENTDQESAQVPAVFQFRLSEKTMSDGNVVYVPVKEAVYAVEHGASQLTYRTDENGEFSIKTNETARFSGLKAGDYKVEEINLSEEYEAKDGVVSQEGMLSREPLSFTFTNMYTWKRLDLYLMKRNHSDEPLAGAEFMLYRDENLTNPVKDESFTTTETGAVIMGDLKEGTYYLKETKAPRGYQLLVNPITVKIERVGMNMKVAVDGEVCTNTDPSQQIYVKNNADTNDEVHITVYNSKNFELPSTGGVGIWLLIGAGFAGICLLLWRRKA